MSSSNPSTIRLPLSKLALNAPINASDFPQSSHASTSTNKQSLSRQQSPQQAPRPTQASAAGQHRPSTSSAGPHHHTAQGLHGPAHSSHLRLASSSLATSAQQTAARGLDRVDIGQYDGGFEADERKRESEAATAGGQAAGARKSEQERPQQQEGQQRDDSGPAPSQVSRHVRSSPCFLARMKGN